MGRGQCVLMRWISAWIKWNDWCLILHCNVILGQGQFELMIWILVQIMPQVQDLSLDLLTGSPVCYHCAMDAPFGVNHDPGAGLIARPVDLQSAALPPYYYCATTAPSLPDQKSQVTTHDIYSAKSCQVKQSRAILQSTHQPRQSALSCSNTAP